MNETGDVLLRNAYSRNPAASRASLRVSPQPTSLTGIRTRPFAPDETLWTGEVIDGRWCLCDGKSGPVSVRLLHVFQFAADGKFKSERVWFDHAAIQQQLGSAERPEVVAAHR